jgi:hypothetical protein
MDASSRRPVHLRLVREWPCEELTVEANPVSAGIKGGLAGGSAMAIVAMLCGALSGHGIWYPINLLSAGFSPGAATETAAELSRFQVSSFAVAAVIQLIASLVVGLLYGAILPMISRRSALIAAFAAPMLGSAVLHTIVGIVNPLLDRRIDWFWFAISQVAFGIVAGIVVSKQLRSPPSFVSGRRERLRSPASPPPRYGIPGR